MSGYRLEKNGDFIIENYDKLKAFSSFFPGIAGLHGIPLWAFYVNRGQCVTSFGTKDKDGAILEFLPANQAYNMTAIKGYRTFIRIKKGKKRCLYEPFKEAGAGSSRISKRMTIRSYELELEERNESLGIAVYVSYTTVPNRDYPALARRLTLLNISGRDMEIELLDGLPAIVPYGMTDWHAKHMSRTIEAWMVVSNAEKKAPFYNLKINPQDTPELEFVKQGNFYAAFRRSGRVLKALDVAVDPDTVFGINGDLSYPRLFAEKGLGIFSLGSASEGKMPSAFCGTAFRLKRGKEQSVISVTGNTGSVGDLNGIVRSIRMRPDIYEETRSANRDILKSLESRIFTKSSSDEFDFYTRQTYLDNLLRGGVPIDINTTKGAFPYYVYARKHGDLERDYNAFLLEPTYYSQGNGAYRDINQNRRNDIFFNPSTAEMNIKTFMNAIQPDGFNPHRIRGVKFYLKREKRAEPILKRYISSAGDRKKMKSFLASGFTPGSFTGVFRNISSFGRRQSDRFLSEMLPLCDYEDIIEPGEGYWIDHWTYNIGLFENYIAFYPERFGALLLEATFYFYDTYLRVLPRSDKYVHGPAGIRQIGSVVTDEKKRSFIDQRDFEKHKVRTDYGKGGVYRTSLLTKLITVLVNKIASLDSFGAGIEMEAGKPGWCDSLNGLPAIFGSSMCEVFEIKRLIKLLYSAFAGMNPETERIAVPVELWRFALDIETLIKKSLDGGGRRKDFKYWDDASSRKELYRDEVWYGFSGREKEVTIARVKELLEGILAKVDTAVKKGHSRKSGMTYSYFMHEATDFSYVRKEGRVKRGRDGLPRVKVKAFRRKPVSLFLEGPVHAMRVTRSSDAGKIHKAILKSGIYDRKLKMFKVNEPLEGMPLEIGRSAIFTPGWLENESVWLHMEYKYLLELLKANLYEEFFTSLKRCLVAFQDPAVYGRSILENSSFIASSAYPDKRLHGNGYVARLTGTTTEFVTMWIIMCVGSQPFVPDGKMHPIFKPRPVIPSSFFTKKAGRFELPDKAGGFRNVRLPANVFAFMLFSKTLCVYHNPKRLDTFGEGGARILSVKLKKRGAEDIAISGDEVPCGWSRRIRKGLFDRIDITLG